MRAGLRLFILILVAVLGLFRPAAAAPMQAAPADRFVDSFGVNIHMHYTDTVYWNFEKLKTTLRELGVRHVRDGLVFNGRTEYYERFRDLGASGIDALLIVSGDLSKLKPTLDKLKPAVFALEGPNEVNLNRWKSDSARNYQRALWGAVQGDPELKRLPVVALSSTNLNYSKELGDLGEWCTYGNVHPYPGGWDPENKATWMRADLAAGMALARANCGAKPVIITETGYTNSLNEHNKHQPVSEHAAGVYLPRIYLNWFRQGVVRTYWYELFDLKPEPELKNDQHHFGLVRNDGTKKPAAWAMQNMIHLLADPGPEFKAASLDVTLSDEKAQAMLFQKRGGEFWLALWLPESQWDHSRPYGKKLESDPPARPCTVKLGTAPARVTSYTALDQETPVQAALPAGPELKVPVSGSVTLLRLEMK